MFSASNKAPLPNLLEGPQNQWEDHAQEIENYFQHLLSSNADEDGNHGDDTGSGRGDETDSASLVSFPSPTIVQYCFFHPSLAA